MKTNKSAGAAERGVGKSEGFGDGAEGQQKQRKWWGGGVDCLCYMNIRKTVLDQNNRQGQEDLCGLLVDVGFVPLKVEIPFSQDG